MIYFFILRCFLRQDALCAKSVKMPDEVYTVVKTVTSICVSALNHRKFVVILWK
jgi:hypothetical protein